MNARRLLVPLLVIIALFSAACGGSSPGGTTSPTAASGGPAAVTGTEAAGPAAAPAGGDAIQMRMAWWGSQDRHDRTIKVIELFQKENPNVKITWEFSAFDDYWTKLTTQAAGGNLPCLIQQDYAKIGEWVSRDLLLPLDDYIQNGTIDTKNVEKTYLDGGKLNDKVYAISLGTNSQSLIYDPALFEKAGIPLPSNDWTWKEFDQVTTQLKDKLSIYGMSVGIEDWQVMKLWLKQHGKTFYNPEGTGLGYDDDKMYVEFFTMIKGLMDKGAMPNREFEVSRGAPPVEDDPLVKQQAAIGYMWSNQIVAVSSAANRPLKAGLFPKLDASSTQTGHYLKPSQFFSITAKCDQPEVAAKLINMFTNSIPANEILLAERGVPISSEVRKALEGKIKDAQKEAFALVALVEKNPSPLDPPDPAGHSEVISKVYTPLMDQVLYGQLAPEEAAKQFREGADAILAKNKK
jgi:pectin-derived oligosaccharide transport system substrate-binding protein